MLLFKKIMSFLIVLNMISLFLLPVVVLGAPETLPESGYKIDMDLIPKVYLGEHKDWERLYDEAWQFHKNNIRNNKSNITGISDYWVDEAFDNNLYQWDTLFMMLFNKYGYQQFPTLPSMNNFYRGQFDSNGTTEGDKQNGFISRIINETNGRPQYKYDNADAINPPLFGWAEWEQYLLHNDKERFTQPLTSYMSSSIQNVPSNVVSPVSKTVLQRMIDYFEFIKRNRTYTNGVGKDLFYSAGQANGLDNTPNQDWGAKREVYNDISIQMVQYADSISKIAAEVGDTANAYKYAGERDRISALINSTLWDETDGFYYNYDRSKGTLTKIKTPTGLWAMTAGVASTKQAERLVQSMLNSEELFRPNGLSTVAYNYSSFKPTGGYWNGAVWAPTSYQALDGLKKYGYEDLAFQMAIQHLNTFSEVYKQGAYDRNGNFLHTLWENYSSEYTLPGSTEFSDNEASRKDFVGWTGAIPIASLIEYILGIDVNAPKNTINWSIRLLEEHGMDGLVFGNPANQSDNIVSLRAAARKSGTSGTTITVNAQKPLKLKVNMNDVIKTFDVKAGAQTFTVDGIDGNTPFLSAAKQELNNQQDRIDSIIQSKDFVLFSDKTDNTVVDGIKNRYGKSKEERLIYNVNTIGHRNATLKPAIQMENSIDGVQLFEMAKSGVNEGFMAMAPANNRLQTLRLVLGVKNAKATMTASLSDSSQPDMNMQLRGGDKEVEYVIDVPYRAGSKDKNILIKYVIAENEPGKKGVITLKGISLNDGGQEYEQPSDAPTNVTVIPGDNSLTVNADISNQANLDGYKIQLGLTPFDKINEYSTTSLPFTINGLDNHTKYYVAIQGVKNSIDGNLSEFVSGVPEEGGGKATLEEKVNRDLVTILPQILNGNSDLGNITDKLKFESIEGLLYGSQVKVSSLTTNAIDVNGNVIRSVGANADKKAIIAVQITLGTYTTTRQFIATVKSVDPAVEPYVAADLKDYSENINLTEQGELDWVHFDRITASDFPRKKNANQIADISFSSGMPDENPKDYPRKVLYTDGQTSNGDVPIVTESSNQSMYFTGISGQNKKLEFTLHGDNELRDARIYLGSWNSMVRIQATSSNDPSKIYYSNTFGKNSSAGVLVKELVIKYQLPKNDKLKVTISVDNGQKAFIQAITLRNALIEKEKNVNVVAAPAQADLTIEGSKDWAHFNNKTPDAYERKNIMSSYITDFSTLTGTTIEKVATDTATNFTYSDAAGSNYTETSGNSKGLVAQRTGGGFQFTLPYSSAKQSAKIFAGSWASTISAELYITEDGKPDELYDKVEFGKNTTTSGAESYIVQLNYQLDHPGQKLKVKMYNKQLYDSTYGNMSLQAITLREDTSYTYSSLHASAGEGGTITPNGVLSVIRNTSQPFIIEPLPGYQLDKLYVNDTEVLGFNGLVFDVTATSDNMKIHASFKQKTFKVTTMAGSGGTITADKNEVEKDGSVTITVTPDKNYDILDVLVNSKPVKLNLQNQYTFNGVRTNVVVSAAFKKSSQTEVTSGVLSAKEEIEVGEQFAVVYGLKNTQDPVYGQDVTFMYDSEKLRLVTYKASSEGFQIVHKKDDTPGILRVISAGMGSGVTNGDNIILTFEALAAVEAPGTTIQAMDSVIANGVGLEQVLEDATLSVVVNKASVGLPGDVNQDGKHSIGDLAMIAAAYGKRSTDVDWEKYSKLDVNKDNVINIEDLAFVASKILSN